MLSSATNVVQPVGTFVVDINHSGVLVHARLALLKILCWRVTVQRVLVLS